jgi:hypothetical protein
MIGEIADGEIHDLDAKRPLRVAITTHLQDPSGADSISGLEVCTSVTYTTHGSSPIPGIS